MLFASIRPSESRTLDVQGASLEDVYAKLEQQTPAGFDLVSAPVRIKGAALMEATATFHRREAPTAIEADDMATLAGEGAGRVADVVRAEGLIRFPSLAPLVPLDDEHVHRRARQRASDGGHRHDPARRIRSQRLSGELLRRECPQLASVDDRLSYRLGHVDMSILCAIRILPTTPRPPAFEILDRIPTRCGLWIPAWCRKRLRLLLEQSHGLEHSGVHPARLSGVALGHLSDVATPDGKPEDRTDDVQEQRDKNPE